MRLFSFTYWNVVRWSVIATVFVLCVKVYLVDQPREMATSSHTRSHAKEISRYYPSNLTTWNSGTSHASTNLESDSDRTEDPIKSPGSETEDPLINEQDMIEEEEEEPEENPSEEPINSSEAPLSEQQHAENEAVEAYPLLNEEEEEMAKEEEDEEQEENPGDKLGYPADTRLWGKQTTAQSSASTMGTLKKKLRARRFLDRPSLHLIGERHSGTNWMTDHLRDCFNDTVDFFRGYSDWKHWTQFDDRRYDLTGAVVVAQFRNVYHWTEAMRFNPYHSPLHFSLEWKDFVTRPWTMPRYDEDLVFEGVTRETSPNVKCRHGRLRKPYEIVPCRANQTFYVEWHGSKRHRVQAFYELRDDGSGLPFDSILGLRSLKIRNFLGMKNFSNVKAFHPVRYEDMVRNGTAQLIQNLENDLKVVAKCQPIKGEPEKGTRPMLYEYVEYMKSHVDWETEALAGYGPNDMM